MDRVLGKRPASQAPVLIDTSADKNSNSDDELDSDDFQSSLTLATESQEPDDEITAEEPDVSAASEPTDQGIEQSKTSQESEKPCTSQGKTLVSKLTRKRKANKVEHALDNVIEKFTSAQNSSEKKFYELEEKRRKQEMAPEEKHMHMHMHMSLEND